jgi:hypothetical protein
LHSIIVFLIYFRAIYAVQRGEAMSGEGMNTDRDRVISITLSETEWQEFVSRQPQPVNWLRERIRDEVKTPPKDNKNAA